MALYNNLTNFYVQSRQLLRLRVEGDSTLIHSLTELCFIDKEAL